MVIKLENGIPVGLPLMEENFKTLFPEIKFPDVLMPKDTEPHGYGMYNFSSRPQNDPKDYKKIVEGNPIKRDDGIWYQSWELIDMNDEEKNEQNKLKEREVRGIRNNQLYGTDWIWAQDVTLSDEVKQNYIEFRKQLRDISKQEGFPWNITWPTEPSSKQ